MLRYNCTALISTSGYSINGDNSGRADGLVSVVKSCRLSAAQQTR